MEEATDIRQGDCREVMRAMPDNSVDAIVTDPPYGLSFMGKGWDHGVPGVEFWTEALRVAKPGAHLLAFGGTRTYHRLACAIEDAGWEIRDCVMWVYGSGFPKSLDVSKAIDRMDASEEQERRRLRFTTWVRSTGVTSRQIDEATGTNMGGHYTTAASQPGIMTREHLEACRHLFGTVPEWVEREADIRSVESRNMAEREVVGRRTGVNTKLQSIARATSAQGLEKSTKHEFDITAPATPEANKWAGWGTALKPAVEPIVFARKPLIGTVAENVLRHGTGGINVDGCRVGTDDGTRNRPPSKPTSDTYAQDSWTQNPENRKPFNASGQGRFPANLIHDGSDEVVGLFPESNGSGAARMLKRGRREDGWGMQNKPGTLADAGTGSAARFFQVCPPDDARSIIYTAKASKRDRDEGLPRGVRSTHPTVKPTSLMRYLCRLITLPGGVVLDPFCGSGSTGKGAVLEGFRFIGIEREPEYVEIARARIAHAMRKRVDLFTQSQPDGQ